LRILSFFLLAISLQSCCWFGQCGDTPGKNDATLPQFEGTPIVSQLNVNHLDEVSGLSPSYRSTDALWAMEDSGTEPKIDLLRKDGTYIKKVTLGFPNRDWEDLAIAPGPEAGKNYLYVGEIGDNNAVYGDYYVYRFEEPQIDQTHVHEFETIHFRYPNNEMYDAETLIVEPKSKDIYVITKNQLNVRVYRLPYPQSTNSLNIAQYQGDIKYLGMVSGDISPKGDEILLKSYLAIFYWKVREGETFYQTLSRAHDVACPYVLEPQGESVCWDLEAKGYYTLSERSNKAEIPPLYYYFKK
jgi:hypothetical protein